MLNREAGFWKRLINRLGKRNRGFAFRGAASLILLIVLVISAGCSQSKEATSLNNLSSGTVLYYDEATRSEAELIQAQLVKLAGEMDFRATTVQVDTTEGQQKIANYLEKNSQLIESYDRIRELESQMTLLESSNNSDQEAEQKNSVNLAYRMALNRIKDKDMTAEQEKQIDQLLTYLISVQSLDREGLQELLELQKRPRLQVPLFSEKDGDKSSEGLPVLKIVYEGNVRKSYAFGKQKIDASVLLEPELLKSFLVDDAWIGQFKATDEIEQLKSKLENKESFVLYLFGNTCPHCKKLQPYMEKVAEGLGTSYFSLDLFKEKNSHGFDDLWKDGAFDLTEPKWVPTIIAIKDGKQVQTISAYDWAVEAADAELGYNINEDVLLSFFLKYAP